MKTKVPYNAGEIRIVKNRYGGNKKVFIAGHIWWPVEQRNAYYCLKVLPNGELSDVPEYIWDKTDGGWELCAA